MPINRVHMYPDAADRLLKAPGTGWALRAVAEKAGKKVKRPKDQEIAIRAGIGHRGAFAQVMMRGPRAVFIEFGTRHQKALAPLRNAVFGLKGVRAAFSLEGVKSGLRGPRLGRR